MLPIKKVVLEYYDQLITKNLTDQDFNQWIDSLQDPMRSHFKAKGLDACRGVLNFQRFILEMQDKGLNEYLKERLTEDDFSYWTSQNKP